MGEGQDEGVKYILVETIFKKIYNIHEMRYSFLVVYNA